MGALQAAKDLHELGPKYVLIKGGHLISPVTETQQPLSLRHHQQQTQPRQLPAQDSSQPANHAGFVSATQRSANDQQDDSKAAEQDSATEATQNSAELATAVDLGPLSQGNAAQHIADESVTDRVTAEPDLPRQQQTAVLPEEEAETGVRQQSGRTQLELGQLARALLLAHWK